ncbi:MAG TPA: ArsA-related P-loop ATPase [Gemmatimonadales bacterium]
MKLPQALDRRLLIVVGAGGVGKTTLAAALGMVLARAGADTLVMTFDPSRRLKDALGVGRVPVDTPGALHASLLDAQTTFDGLVRRYAPDGAAATRIFENRFYRHLAGSLAGVLEYMAVERLFEVARDSQFQRIILDTPPTRQALDFLQAPERITEFLASDTLRLARRSWFDPQGNLRLARLGPVGRKIAKWLDTLVGLDLLREVAEFFQAFGPLYDGFRERAAAVQKLLRARETGFILVTGPGAERIPDMLFFARRLREAGHDLRLIIVNQVHPVVAGQPSLEPGEESDGLRLLAWLGEHHRRGLDELSKVLGPKDPWVSLPLLPETPAGLPALEALGTTLFDRISQRF